MATRQYIGARYVPKFYTNSVDGTTQWESNVVYEPLIYVTLTNGHMYISKKQVPATVGTPASNADYWLDVGSYNGFIEELQNQIDTLDTEVGKLSDNIYDISKYGAVADDGVTDNTAIIQAGIDAGKVVFIPHGKWGVTQLEMKYGAKIIGVSDGFASVDGSTLVAIGNSGSVIHCADGIHAWVIKDISINGKATNSTSKDGIHIDATCTKFVIDNVYIRYCNNGIFIGGLGWALLNNCFVELCYGDGFKFDNGTGPIYHALQVYCFNCMAQHCEKSGFAFYNNDTSAHPGGNLLNCGTFRNQEYGLKCSGGLAAMRISNCFFGSDNTAEMYFNGNNGQYTVTATGVQMELAGAEPAGVGSLHAASNAGMGVRIQGGYNVTLDNCMFVGMTSMPLYIIGSSKAIVNACTFALNNSSMGAQAIELDQSKLILSNNRINAGTKRILTAYDADDELLATGNVFEDYGTDGLVLLPANTKLHQFNNVAKDGSIYT